jgi:DNA-binding NarL/FixJ family response regulator
MERALRALVLEHGSAFTHALTLACRSTDLVVLGPVRDIEAARAAMHVAAIDVLTIEIRPSARDLVREAASAFPRVPVLAVADVADPAAGAGIIAAGASGVLERGAARREIVDAVRRVAAGELILPAAHLTALVELIGLARQGRGPSRMETLTRREREVLALLADGMTTGDVASALSISVFTVQTHVKNVLAKLGVHSKVEAIRYAWRSGSLRMPVGA